MKKTIKLFLLLCLILGLQGAALANTNQGVYEDKTFFVSFLNFTVDENNKTSVYNDLIETLDNLEASPVEKIEAVSLSLYKYKINDYPKQQKPLYRVSLMTSKKPNNNDIIDHLQPIKLTYTTINNKTKNIILTENTEEVKFNFVVFLNRNIESTKIEQLKDAKKITAELKTTDNKTVKIDFPPEIIAEWQSVIKHDLSGIVEKKDK